MLYEYSDFKRREFISGGADPTICVEWRHIPTGDTLVEFQGVILGNGQFEGNDEVFHFLEMIHKLDQALDEELPEYDGDPIYGGA